MAEWLEWLNGFSLVACVLVVREKPFSHSTIQTIQNIQFARTRERIISMYVG